MIVYDKNGRELYSGDNIKFEMAGYNKDDYDIIQEEGDELWYIYEVDENDEMDDYGVCASDLSHEELADGNIRLLNYTYIG